MAEVCADNAVGLTLVPVTGEASDVERVAEAAVDGFVVWTSADDDPVVDAVASSGLPSVIHSGPHGRRLAVVGIDDRAAARAIGLEAFAGAQRPAVLSFPLDRNRRRRLLAGPDPARATFPVTRHRLQGFQDAWRDLGGSWAGLRVAACPGNSAAHGAAFAADMLAGGDPPDAIAAMSDELALGALRAAAHARLVVPDALAVTGWDDSDAAARAGLTTVAQSLHDQGVRCARIALGLEQRTSMDDQAPWQMRRRKSTRVRQGG